MVLVCSKGGGGLLTERMELASELWEKNIRVRRCLFFSIKAACPQLLLAI